MTSGIRIHLAGALVLGLGLTVAPSVATEDGVRAAFERFQEAFLAADVETLDALLTEDYVHGNGGSLPIDRRAWLDWVASRRERVESGELAYESYAVEELEIRLRGDTATVTGRARGTGRDGDRRFTVDVRFLQLWVRDRGAWRRAAFQDAAVPAESAP